MSDTSKIMKSLPELLALKPATETEITDAEIQLGFRFAGDYRQYLSEFGAIIADGTELTGMAKSAHRNVVSATKTERDLNGKIPADFYVVENLGIDGIIIWQSAKNNEIYQSSPGSPPKRIAESLGECLATKKRWHA